MESAQYKTMADTEEAHWWYRARREMVTGLLKKYVRGGSKIKILDIGCGTGGLLRELTECGECQGLDLSEEALEYCRAKGLKNVGKGSAENIPFPDNSFDVVLVLDVLEHIEDDAAALKEIRRVMKNEGVAIITVPAFMFLWGVSDRLGRHFRRYERSMLLAKAESAGLVVVRSSYFNTFLFFPIAIVRTMVRSLHLPVGSENEATGEGVINSILYRIFRAEFFLLKFMNFPFGVSIFVICKK